MVKHSGLMLLLAYAQGILTGLAIAYLLAHFLGMLGG